MTGQWVWGFGTGPLTLFVLGIFDNVIVDIIIIFGDTEKLSDYVSSFGPQQLRDRSICQPRNTIPPTQMHTFYTINTPRALRLAPRVHLWTGPCFLLLRQALREPRLASNSICGWRWSGTSDPSLLLPDRWDYRHSPHAQFCAVLRINPVAVSRYASILATELHSWYQK